MGEEYLVHEDSDQVVVVVHHRKDLADLVEDSQLMDFPGAQILSFLQGLSGRLYGGSVHLFVTSGSEVLRHTDHHKLHQVVSQLIQHLALAHDFGADCSDIRTLGHIHVPWIDSDAMITRGRVRR